MITPAQSWLDEKYPKNEREIITELEDISLNLLNNSLRPEGFANLTGLNVSF
ncbi:hypothetical protein GvMRE_IIg198 [endosymbiont GvMRE of Glomus versiforme]|nr:hypothetical protein GvMRE_IIg198 [endosymbiont GvMRE of Glomus versiforme]